MDPFDLPLALAPCKRQKTLLRHQRGRVVPQHVSQKGRRERRRRAVGRPKPGYAELCAAAARSWKLPERYARSLERWSVSRWTGSRVIGVGDGT